MREINKRFIFFGLLSTYGILTFVASHTNMILLSTAVALAWGIFYWKNVNPTVLISYLNIKKTTHLLLLFTTFLMFTLMNVTIDRPLPFLTKTHELSLKAIGNVHISSLQINSEHLELQSLGQEAGWTYNDGLRGSSSSDDLVLKDLGPELVSITFIKSDEAGSVELYRDQHLIKTINLASDTEYDLKIKATPDHALLLIPAYLGVFGALYLTLQMVMNRCLRQNKKIASFSERLKLKLSRYDALKSNKSLTYVSLPLFLLAGFKWIGLANLTLRPLFITLFLIGMIVLEVILFKKCHHKVVRGSFYLSWFSIVTILFMQLIYFFPNFDVSMHWIAHHIHLIFLSATFVFSLSCLLFALFNNFILSISLSALFMIIAGVANYYKMLVIGEPIYASDMSMIFNIQDIMMYAQGILSPELLITILCISVLLGVCSFIFGKAYKMPLKTRFVTLLLAGGYLLCLFNYEKSILKPLVNSTVNYVKWNQLSNYEQNGLLFGFITNLQNELMAKPDSYNEQQMNEIVAHYKAAAKAHNEDKSTEELPNIMVIISESLSDPTVFNQLTFSEDPLPTLRHYMDNHTSGRFLSPFKGNRTANIEFEFLLGFTNSLLLEGTVPFQQNLSTMSEIPSMVSYLKDFGYDSVAIHPNNAAFYKRSSVYPAAGFDNFLSMDKMEFTDLIVSEKYISDESVFNEMLKELNNATAPIFTYGLTMQNHVPTFENKYGKTTIDVTDASGDAAIELELENYAEGLKQSDAAFQSFMTSIENHDEPTIVIFFGDHLINFTSQIHENHGFEERNPDAINAKLFFETPLLMMSNRGELDLTDFDDVSPIFLAPLLFEALDLPLSPFYMFLLDLYDEFNVLHNDFMMDANQNQIVTLSPTQQTLLTTLELIQYDFLEGEQYAFDELFTVSQ